MEVVSGVARVARCSHFSGWPCITAKGGKVWKKTPSMLRAPGVMLEVEPVREDGDLDPIHRGERGARPGSGDDLRPEALDGERGLAGRSRTQVGPEDDMGAPDLPPARVRPRHASQQQPEDDGPCDVPPHGCPPFAWTLVRRLPSGAPG